jgi:hypothetical protein
LLLLSLLLTGPASVVESSQELGRIL